MWRGRPQTDLWTGERPGRDSAFDFSRSCRAHRTYGGGRCRIFAAIAGYHPADKASVDAPVEDYVAASKKSFQPLRVGLPKKFFFEDLDPEVASAINHAVSGLSAMGAEIREIELPVPIDRTLQSAEAYAFHAEFVARNPELYQPETLRRIRTGQNVSPEARA